MKYSQLYMNLYPLYPMEHPVTPDSPLLYGHDMLYKVCLVRYCLNHHNLLKNHCLVCVNFVHGVRRFCYIFVIETYCDSGKRTQTSTSEKTKDFKQGHGISNVTYTAGVSKKYLQFTREMLWISHMPQSDCQDPSGAYSSNRVGEYKIRDNDFLITCPLGPLLMGQDGLKDNEASLR